MAAYLSNALVSWASFYANHAAVRTLIAFVHVAALIGGGGLAIAADRATLAAHGKDDAGRRTQLEALRAAHRTVIVSLVLIVVSGVLLFAADVETYLYSRFFWTKMGLVAALVANGALLWTAERRAQRGDQSAWPRLRATAVASIVLWLLTTLGGVGLPNIG